MLPKRQCFLIKKCMAYKNKKVVITASCDGGFCELSKIKKNDYSKFKSNGEGIVPPCKNKNNVIPAYKVSYPDNTYVQSETFSPNFLFWMGRRWYSSP